MVETRSKAATLPLPTQAGAIAFSLPAEVGNAATPSVATIGGRTRPGAIRRGAGATVLGRLYRLVSGIRSNGELVVSQARPIQRRLGTKSRHHHTLILPGTPIPRVQRS